MNDKLYADIASRIRREYEETREQYAAREQFEESISRLAAIVGTAREISLAIRHNDPTFNRDAFMSDALPHPWA